MNCYSRRFVFAPWAGMLMCLILAFIGCKQKAAPPRAENSGGYTLNRPVTHKLPAELDEISGLFYLPKDSSLLAVGDERGYIYKIRPGQRRSMERWHFDRNGDYEDLIAVGDSIYVLESNGNLHVVHIDGQGAANTVNYDFPGKKSEFEGLFYDTAASKVVLLCKDCEVDKNVGKRYLSMYYFDPVSHNYTLAPFKINVEGIALNVGVPKLKFKPSGVTVNPSNGHLFMVSAINRMLVETTREGSVVAVHVVDDRIYKQPEGIAFSRNGTLYISNEAADVGLANILILPFRNR